VQQGSLESFSFKEIVISEDLDLAPSPVSPSFQLGLDKLEILFRIAFANAKFLLIPRRMFTKKYYEM
jgi:hypothetical protein